jgi:hypothetical protein
MTDDLKELTRLVNAAKSIMLTAEKQELAKAYARQISKDYNNSGYFIVLDNTASFSLHFREGFPCGGISFRILTENGVANNLVYFEPKLTYEAELSLIELYLPLIAKVKRMSTYLYGSDAETYDFKRAYYFPSADLGVSYVEEFLFDAINPELRLLSIFLTEIEF